MRRLLLVVAATFVWTILPSSAQPNDDAREMVRYITESLASGETDVLTKLSAAQIELTLADQTSVYTKGQAKYVARAFLDQHPIREARVREVNVLGRQCTARSRLVGVDRSEKWELYLRLRRTREGWELKELRLTQARGKTSR